MLELGIVRFPAVYVRNTAVIMVQTWPNIGLHVSGDHAFQIEVRGAERDSLDKLMCVGLRAVTANLWLLLIKASIRMSEGNEVVKMFDEISRV